MRPVLSLLLILPITASAQTITRVQLIPLSNYVGAVSTSLTVASNYLYSQISVGVTEAQVTNISQVISTITSNGVVLFTLTASNNLVTVFQARDITTSNGVVSFTMTASNNLASLLSVNDTFTSNALRTAYLAADITTSNGAVAFTITASNVLRTDISNLQGATNGLVARANNLEGATNGLNSGVVGLLSRAVTNSDTRSIGLSTLTVRSGSSTSNAFVGGSLWFNLTATPNPTSNGTVSPLISIPVRAHTMTNLGDRCAFKFAGMMPTAQANTNQFVLVCNNGGPNVTLLDTGMQTSSNTTYEVTLGITRTGNASHFVDARLEWGPNGGVPFLFTNRQFMTTTTTNGLDLSVILQSTARRQGSHTNLMARAWFDPAPR